MATEEVFGPCHGCISERLLPMLSAAGKPVCFRLLLPGRTYPFRLLEEYLPTRDVYHRFAQIFFHLQLASPEGTQRLAPLI